MGTGLSFADRSSRPAASPRIKTRAVAAAFALLTTAACSPSSGAPPGTATSAAIQTPVTGATPTLISASPSPAPPPAFTSTGAELGEIVWATAVDATTKAPVEPVAQFVPQAETIYAAIPVLRLEAGSVVTAEWTYNDTPIEPLTRQVTADARYVDSWIEFHITRAPDAPWPTGTYQIRIKVGQGEALTSSVEVQDDEA